MLMKRSAARRSSNAQQGSVPAFSFFVASFQPMIPTFSILCLWAALISVASSQQLSALELPEPEYAALSDLYFATDGIRWNWQTPYVLHGNPWTFGSAVNPCTDSWQGVTCTAKSGKYHVTDLTLDSLRLRGPIPNSLCNLTDIRIFSLSDNSVDGTIPDCIGTLTSLTEIDLSGNRLEGTIPESLRQLSQIGTLYLDSNSINGTLDVLCGITSLQEVTLYKNIMTGTIPECIGALFLLSNINIYRNNINGTIPASLGNLTQLTELGVDELDLTGTIPSSLGNLTNLVYLFLSNNNLTGTIPDTLGNMTNLNQIELGSNRLSGTIPTSLGQLRKLENIAIGNCFLTGSIPSAIFDMHIMVYLDLNNNHLTGSIPETVGNMNLLGDISLENNKLTGPFPESLFNLTLLVNILLGGNELSGSLPSELSKLPRPVKYFQIDNNRLTGTIPSTIEYLIGMFEMDFGYNHLHGTIPTTIGNVRPLAEVDLSNNILSGPIPDSFQNLTGLAELSLQGNKLTGRLNNFVSPVQERITTVQLDNNQFTGELPAVLFQLRSLISLSIVGSCLHGTLPTNICNATQLEALILQGLTTGTSCRTAGIPSMSLHTTPQFEGSLPLCLLSMPRLRTLLLSSNGFTGQLDNNNVPLGRVLSQLDLSHNLLSGPIPDVIQYHNWSVLDLSHNKFNGVINLPLKISPLHVYIENQSQLTFHPSLYLDTNRLSGPVPNSVKQLQSNLSVLAGNLFQCRYDKTDLPQHDSDVDEYECASNSFNIAIYLWLGLTLFAAVFIVLYYRLYSASADSFKVSRVSTAGPLSALGHVADLFAVYERLHKVVGYCTLFCLVVLMPYYAVISQTNSTHTHTYAYVVSALYTTGVTPFAVTTVLLFLLLMIVVVYFFRKWHSVPHVNTAILYRWRQLITVGVVFAVSNTVIVLGFNVLFVYIVLFQSSEAQTVAQVSLSVFKLVWSMAVSPFMMRKIDAYFLPQSNDPTSKTRPNYFTLQLFVGLFNNIAIPCLVVMAIDPNCFGDIFLPPGTRTVYYLQPVCERNGFLNPCQFQSVDITSISFTPPFTYSYQCSASFITAYAPAFVYMSISNVFLHPVLQTVLLYVRSRAADPSMVHKLLSKLLPRLLRPPSARAYQKCLEQKRSLVGGGDVMVTLFTQFGILMTFGAIFPPVALAMAVSIASIVYLMRFKVQRFVQAAVDAQLLGYLDVINAECAGVGTREQMQLAVKIIVCYCCAFYTLFLFDALGDAEGFAASAWVLIVVPLLPIAVFLANEFVFAHKVVIAECDASPAPADVELKEIKLNGNESVSCEYCESGVPTQFTVNPIRTNFV